MSEPDSELTDKDIDVADVGDMVSSFLEAYEATPQNAYALLRAATVIAKLSGCTRETYVKMTERMYDRTEVSVVPMVDGSDLPS